LDNENQKSIEHFVSLGQGQQFTKSNMVNWHYKKNSNCNLKKKKKDLRYKKHYKVLMSCAHVPLLKIAKIYGQNFVK
jgi:hypothetical protein